MKKRRSDDDESSPERDTQPDPEFERPKPAPLAVPVNAPIAPAAPVYYRVIRGIKFVQDGIVCNLAEGLIVNDVTHDLSALRQLGAVFEQCDAPMPLRLD